MPSELVTDGAQVAPFGHVTIGLQQAKMILDATPGPKRLAENLKNQQAPGTTTDSETDTNTNTDTDD
jgi:hypothetical protein